MKITDRLLLFLSLMIIVIIYAVYMWSMTNISVLLGIITSLFIITDVIANIYFEYKIGELTEEEPKRQPLIKRGTNKNEQPLIDKEYFSSVNKLKINNKTIQKEVNNVIEKRDKELDAEFPFLTKQTDNALHYGSYVDEGRTTHRILPLVEPKYPYKSDGNLNDNIVAFEVSRIRNEQAIDGTINKSTDYYKYFYGNEFKNEEEKEWW